MIRTKRLLTAVPVALAAAALIGAGPAYASGGGGTSGGGGGTSGGGGGGTSGGGTSTATFCPFQGVQDAGGDTSLFGIEANGAGCVVVWSFAGGTGMMAAQIITAPGWTFENKVEPSPGHFTNQVDVRFTQTATGDRVEVLAEPGKTEVK